MRLFTFPVSFSQICPRAREENREFQPNDADAKARTPARSGRHQIRGRVLFEPKPV